MLKDSQLKINDLPFRTKSLAIEDIERISIEPYWYDSSKIILKDKSVVKYRDSQISYKKLKEFMGQFGIPVE